MRKPPDLLNDPLRVAAGVVTDPLRAAHVGLRLGQRRVRRLISRAGRKTGLPPGTIIFTAPEAGEETTTQIEATIFDADSVEVKQIEDVSELSALRGPGRRLWLNVVGLNDAETLTAIGEQFGVHPLVLEDIARTGQRPKMEEYEGYIFVVLKMLSFDDDTQSVEYEQIAMVMGPDFLLSFQERVGDVFDVLRERMHIPHSKLRTSGIDYLTYRLLDVTVDHYFIVLERIGDRIEGLEATLMHNTDSDQLATIHSLKQETLVLRKSVWPLRELLTRLERDGSGLIQPETRLFLRDVYDHAIEVIDTVETIRDLISGMLDVYLTNVSNRMNEVMKVLTIISTIFVPLTFIVGIYGMNFQYMPELSEPWAYPVVWGIMVAVVVAMLIFFRRKRWL